MIRGTKSSWRPVTSAAPQGSTLGLVLFNVFINGLDDVAESLLMTRNWEERLICQRAALPAGETATGRTNGPTGTSQSSAGKCKALHPGRNSLRHQDVLESSRDKDPGVLVDTKLNVSQQ